MDLPGVPPELLENLAAAAGTAPIALVGGAVRDLLLHRVHQDPWRGLPDLDLVVEGPPDAVASAAVRVARELESRSDGRLLAWREHGAYGTVELEMSMAGFGTFRLDVATARRERYPVAAANPVVSFGSLIDDLARRDFSINAMALRLAKDGEATPPVLLDPHGGQADLRDRRLRFLHPASLRDDPTRLLRAARYAARLGFQLETESLVQAQQTLKDWPWPWRPGDPPERAPAALGTRLRKELELLLEREPWPQGLEALQGWGGLGLLDAALQVDGSWRRRLRWADRLGLPRLMALIAAADDPLRLALRLQLPHRQQQLLAGLKELRARLEEASAADSPLTWTARLEAHGLPAEAVALALAVGVEPRRPLLRWWLRWRRIGPAISARELIEAGAPAGPALGERLRRSRAGRLELERL
ncbi:CCA tRNA nucleotidyltransferase [Microcystis elabens FACHB-917]|nr:CCA tRNA nucleotidyltransferase [Microcystis elabens FACHB-917]